MLLRDLNDDPPVHRQFIPDILLTRQALFVNLDRKVVFLAILKPNRHENPIILREKPNTLTEE